MTERNPHQPARLAFFRQFAELVDAGVTLLQCARLLAEEAPEPYGDFATELEERLLEGSPLSALMEARPELFPAPLPGLVKAGEVGGVMELALAFAVELQQTEWRFGKLPGREGALPRALLCKTLGWMLSAGVPTTMALETASALLHEEQRHLMPVGEGPVGARLAESGLLGPIASILLVVADEEGAVEVALERVARLQLDLLAWEAEAGG